MKTKVFIDGESGTVGLQIRERLSGINNLEIITLPPEISENITERKRCINEADFVFLCLPDEAAKESVSVIENHGVRVIDASTAHRINPDWDYGFPELSEKHMERIRTSKRVATPGCYASGFIALIFPLIEAGIIPKDERINCFGVSGYSGAGKVFIDEYKRADERIPAKLYALTQQHKHLPEMKQHSGLNITPIFNPIIDNFYSGMIVNIPLHTGGRFGVRDILNVYGKHYKSGNVKVISEYNDAFLPADALSGSDEMQLFAFGNDEHILLTARFDNLGKGASGAAVQCFNIMKGNHND